MLAWLGIAVTLVALGFAPAVAAPAEDALFDKPHLKGVAPGTTLLYRFERDVADPALLGPSFTDSITVQVIGEGKEPGTRQVSIQVFTGERARDPVPVGDISINPVVVFFLDREIATVARFTGGNLPYFKNHFRLAYRTSAASEPTAIDRNGTAVPASRITLQPFLTDPNAARMKGFEKIRYEFVMSDTVPGGVLEMSATVEGADGKTNYRERIVFDTARGN